MRKQAYSKESSRMTPILASQFVEVIAWIVLVFFWMLAIWMFIAVFGDIFRRRDMSGWTKAFWVLLIFIIPFLGALIYIIVRPPMATYEQDMEMIQKQKRMMGVTSTDEIAKAHELLQSGAISQAEFDAIKARALG
jgi:hypothetical protein